MSSNNPFGNNNHHNSSQGNLLLDSEDTEYGNNGGEFDYSNQGAFQQTLPAQVNRDILNQQMAAAAQHQ